VTIITGDSIVTFVLPLGCGQRRRTSHWRKSGGWEPRFLFSFDGLQQPITVVDSGWYLRSPAPRPCSNITAGLRRTYPQVVHRLGITSSRSVDKRLIHMGITLWKSAVDKHRDLWTKNGDLWITQQGRN